MLNKRVYKIIVFFMVLVMVMNVSVSFGTSPNGHFLQFGGEAKAATVESGWEKVAGLSNSDWSSPQYCSFPLGDVNKYDYRLYYGSFGSQGYWFLIGLDNTWISAYGVSQKYLDVNTFLADGIRSFSVQNAWAELYRKEKVISSIDYQNDYTNIGPGWEIVSQVSNSDWVNSKNCSFPLGDVSKYDYRLYYGSFGTDGYFYDIDFGNIEIDAYPPSQKYLNVNALIADGVNSFSCLYAWAKLYRKEKNHPPNLMVNSPSQNGTLTEANNCIPSMTVSDPDGNVLTCKYYIDSIEKETKTISNTATAQIVTFNTLDTSILAEGNHTLRFEVSDGMAAPVSQSVDIIVDKMPPVISNEGFTSDDTSITISGSATDTITDVGSLQYRYTIENSAGNNVGGTFPNWVTENVRKISSLSPDTIYNARFEVKDKVGHIASKEQKVRTKAQTPQISITNIKENSMDILFSDSNPSTTQYQIMAGSSYITATGALTSSPVWVTTNNKKITVNGLSPNTQYILKAKAKNGEGAETTFSTQKTGMTLAQSPSNINLKQGINFMKISWDMVNSATGYDIEADGKVSDIGFSTSYTHNGLQAETQHSYRVRVRNAGGTGSWSNYISGTTLPNPPEMPMITDTNETQTVITINWDAVANATGYEIETDGEIIDTALNTTYTDEGLQPDTLHKYGVRAKNTGGNSAWSSIKEIWTLPNSPEIPANLKGKPTRTNIILTWNAADRAEGYEIELDGSICRVESITSYAHEGLSTNSIHTYKIRAWNKGGKSAWSSPLTITTWPEIPSAPTNIMATAERDSITMTWYSAPYAESYDIQVDGSNIVNVKETSYTDKGLLSGTKHQYKIRSKNISGDGQWSNPIEISTLPKVDTTTESTALTNIVAVVTNKSVTISWQAVAANAQYEVEVDGILSDNGKVTVYNHTGLEPVSFHTYRVKTKDVNGNGQWCAVLALSTLPNIPGAPSDVKAVATNTQIELRWTKEEGTGYEVEVDGNTVDAGEVSSYIDSELNPGTSHTYRVRGKNITGVTAWSDSITKSTISPSYEVECIKDVNFNFSLLASNVQDFGDMTFVVTYNPEELEVEDLCEFTQSKDTTSGKISGTNITVKHTAGKIEFTVNESVAAGTTWSGEISTIVFKPIADGKASINFSIE